MYIVDKGRVVEASLGQDAKAYLDEVRHLAEVVRKSPKTDVSLILDLSAAAWLDSAVISVLLGIQLELKSKGGTLFLIGSQPELEKQWEILMLSNKLAVTDSVRTVYELLHLDHLLIVENSYILRNLYKNHYGRNMVVTCVATLQEAQNAYLKYGGTFAFIACDDCLQPGGHGVQPFMDMVRNGGYEGPILAISNETEIDQLLKDWGV